MRGERFSVVLKTTILRKNNTKPLASHNHDHEHNDWMCNAFYDEETSLAVNVYTSLSERLAKEEHIPIRFLPTRSRNVLYVFIDPPKMDPVPDYLYDRQDEYKTAMIHLLMRILYHRTSIYYYIQAKNIQ